MQQNYRKALDLWYRAGELGCTGAYCSIGCAYHYGESVVVDKKKANHYYELAAMGGNLYARYNLGNNELKAGNVERAVKHFIIAAASGDSGSLNQMKRLYSNGHATKANKRRLYQSITILSNILGRDQE